MAPSAKLPTMTPDPRIATNPNLACKCPLSGSRFKIQDSRVAVSPAAISNWLLPCPSPERWLGGTRSGRRRFGSLRLFFICRGRRVIFVALRIEKTVRWAIRKGSSFINLNINGSVCPVGAQLASII